MSLKKQYKQERKVKDELLEKQIEKETKIKITNELVKEYMDEKEKYSNLKDKIPKKGTTR